MKGIRTPAHLLFIVLFFHPTPFQAQPWWTLQNSGTTHDLFGVHFLDATNGWVVGGTTFGGGYVILSTSDGGESWNTRKSGTSFALIDVFFPDPANGWAVGEFGTILHTSDGGQSWDRQVSNDLHNLFSVFFVDANTGWAAGDWSTMLHTTDGGSTWVQQTIASARAISQIHFLDDGQTGLAAGNNGDIFQTTNAGTSWVRMNSGTSQSLGDLTISGDTNAWVVGGNYGASGGAIILHSTDGGVSWSQQTPGTTSHLTGVDFAQDQVGWIVGELGTIIHTTDAGSSWTIQPSGTVESLNSVDVANEVSGWVVGSGGIILHTDSGGKQPEIQCEDITSFQARCRPDGTMRARIILTDLSHTGDPVEFTIDDVPYSTTVGANGIASLSLAGFTPGTHDVELTEPPGCYPPLTATCPTGEELAAGDDEWEDGENFASPSATTLLGNYPNPFNPTTTIRYALSSNFRVTIGIYNMLGQLVKALVDEDQAAGERSVLWDATNDAGSTVSSGLYLVRFTTPNASSTKRLLFLK